MKLKKLQQDTIDSLRKVDENIYFLHYQNDYGLKEIIDANSKNVFDIYMNIQKYFKSNRMLLNPFRKKGGCVGISAFKENDEVLFARNFDYKQTNCLVIWVDNPKAYKSICLADFTFLGYGKKHFQIEKANKARLLAAPYACMDGINEKGLGMSIIEVKFDPSRQKTGKKRMFPNLMLRLALDTCATVDEVTTLFEQFDMQGILGNDYHYHVTDKNGDGALYEYIDNKLQIIKNKQGKYYPNNYMYVPSFFVSEEGNNVNITTYAQERYDIMKMEMPKVKGIYSEIELMNLLEKCKTDHPHRWMPHRVITVWSVVYNLASGKALLSSNNEFDKIYQIDLFKPLKVERIK